MKKLLFTLLLMSPLIVMADQSASSNANPVSGSLAGSASVINQTSISQPVDLSKSVGAAYAPPLSTTLTETCMGSSSFGVGFAGGAVSVGSNWTDENCVRRLNAREISSYGDKQAAKEIMCESESVRKAFKAVGRPCAVDGGVYASATNTKQSQEKMDELMKVSMEREFNRLKRK